jgi:hypothetical protein
MFQRQKTRSVVLVFGAESYYQDANLQQYRAQQNHAEAAGGEPHHCCHQPDHHSFLLDFKVFRNAPAGGGLDTFI